jgi:hypothetical protein
MDVTEIHDWQFGRLRREDNWGWCTKKMEWKPGVNVGLCIQTEITASTTIPEHSRALFNALHAREHELISQAARQELVDGFNEICSYPDEEYRPKEWPFNVETFVNYLSLI